VISLLQRLLKTFVVEDSHGPMPPQWAAHDDSNLHAIWATPRVVIEVVDKVVFRPALRGLSLRQQAAGFEDPDSQRRREDPLR
jgi:hypothetical protein